MCAKVNGFVFLKNAGLVKIICRWYEIVPDEIRLDYEGRGVVMASM